MTDKLVRLMRVVANSGGCRDLRVVRKEFFTSTPAVDASRVFLFRGIHLGMCAMRNSSHGLTARLWQSLEIGFENQQGDMKNMSKKLWLSAVAASLALTAGAALAADISNISGQSCADFSGTWHFVNNQTGGAPAGTLTATWSTGESCTVSASKVNASNQHFYCTAGGTLLSASTNLPGRLVLSDYTCETKEPPKCDPKTQKCP